MTVSGQFSSPPAGSYVAVSGQSPAAADVLPSEVQALTKRLSADLTRERGLAGTNGVQQLDKAQIEGSDSTIQIDPGSDSFRVIVTEALTQSRQP